MGGRRRHSELGGRIELALRRIAAQGEEGRRRGEAGVWELQGILSEAFHLL